MERKSTINRTLGLSYSLPALAVSLLTLALIQSGVYAGDGTWTNLTSGGLWSATANWSGGTVADGSGSTAFFNTLDLTADNLVHLDGSHTLTGLFFGDLLTATAGGWFLDDNASGGANVLTLAGGTPTITVNALGGSKTTTVSATIAGTAGLTKAGAGTLTLNGAAANTFTGGLTINGGTVVEDFTSLATPTDLINNANTLTLATGGILSIKAQASSVTAQTLGNVTVNAGGAQILGNNNSATSTTITLGTLNPTAAGSSLLVGYSTGTSGLTITTTSGTLANGIYSAREVWFNGTANTGYDWATTASGSSPYTLSGYSGYTALPTSVGDSTVNYNMTAATTLGGNVAANTLKLEAPSGDLALGGNTLTVASGGMLFTGSSSRNITGTATTGLTAGNGSGSYDLIVHQVNNSPATVALNVSAVIGDNGGNSVNLVKNGPGALSLGTNNTYTGNTTINGGNLTASVISLPNSIGASSTKVLTINSGGMYIAYRPGTLTGSQLVMNGGTFQNNNGFAPTWSGAVVLNADSFFDGSGNDGGSTTINGNISGVGGLTRSSLVASAILFLNGVNTYTGPTVIRSGTLRFPTPASLYNSDTSKWVPAYITVASGATLYLNVGGASDFSVAQTATLLGNLTTGINNNGMRSGSLIALDTVNSPSSPATVFSAAIANSTGAGGGAVGIKKLGASRTLQLSGANTYTGPTTVSSGTLQAGVATTPGVSGAFGVNSAVSVSDTLDLNGFNTQIGSLTGGGKVTLNAGTLTVGADNTSPAAYSGIMSDGTSQGNLIKTGTGTLTLTGANTYTGTTTVNNGIVNLGKAEVAGTSGPLGNGGLIVFAGGTLQYSAANQYDYSLRFNNAASGQAYKTDNNNQNVTWATALTSSGGTLSKTGAGILTLSGANTYNGATTVNGGILKAGVASVAGVSGALGLNSAVTLANTAGVAVDITGFDTQIGSLTGGGATGGNVTNTSATLTIGGDNTSPAAFAGIITGTGGNLVKFGTGTLTLNNTDNYSGNTIVSGGTLALGGSGALPLTASIAIAAGATYDVSAVGSYTLGTSTMLSASGTDLTTGAATFKGGATANSMNGRPMTLSYTPTSIFGDPSHPALVVINGNLDLSSVLIAVTNNYSALSAGTFTLITNVTGTFGGAPSLAGGTVYGNGVVGGRSAVIALSGDSKAVNLTVTSVHIPVTVTIARHAGTGASSTYGDALSFDVTVTTATSGTVTLYDGGLAGTPIGSGSLSGSTTCTVPAALNGLIAGTHTNIIARFGGDGLGHDPTNSLALTPPQVVGPAGLTVSGALGNDKLFDGTAAATLTGTLVGVISGDTSLEVYLIGTGTFDNGGAVGTGLTITSTSTLGGTKASSYTLTQPTGVTANIWGTAVWTNLTSGLNWSTAGNWTNGLVGSGADVTADFSQLDITHAMTVHLDAPVTIGSLVFGDTVTSSAGSWTLDNNGNALNVLTMAATNSACTITVNALAVNNYVTITHELSLSTNVTMTVAGYQIPVFDQALTLSGPISGTGALTKDGAGALTLNDGTSTYSGGTIINNGSLSSSVGSSGQNGGLGTGPVTLNDATIFFNGPNPIMTNDGIFNGGTLIAQNGFGATWNGNITLNANVTVNATFGMNFGGTISGAGGFTKTGVNTMTLSVANTYTNATIVQAGTLTCDDPAALGSGGPLSISDGATVNLNYSGTHYIVSLTLGSTNMPNGNYGSTASGATSPDDTHFTGTGTVTVGPPPVPPAPVLDPSTGFSVAGGNPTFTFSTVAGFKYRLISSDNVATPLADWQGVPIYSPVVSDANGWVVATDISMTLVDQTYTTGSTPQRFYRIEASRQ